MVSYRTSTAVSRLMSHSLRPINRPSKSLISLASGDPDIDTPKEIRQAMVDALESGFTHYADWNGDLELRRAIAIQKSREVGRAIDVDEVLITHGGTGGLMASVLALVDNDQKVLIPEPTYSLYADLVHYAGGNVVLIPSRSDLRLNIGRIRAEVACGANVLILCNPCNPTGIVLTRDELSEIADIASKNELIVIVDEAYAAITYPEIEFVSALDVTPLSGHLVYCQTFSKAFAMTGWRLGYLIGPKEVIAAAGKVHRTFNLSVNAAVQRAGLVALELGEQWAIALRKEYLARRDYTASWLGQIVGISWLLPEGGFSFFVRVNGHSCEEIVSKAAEHKLALRAGNEFGPSGEEYVRLTFAANLNTLQMGLERFQAVIRDIVI